MSSGDSRGEYCGIAILQTSCSSLSLPVTLKTSWWRVNTLHETCSHVCFRSLINATANVNAHTITEFLLSPDVSEFRFPV